MRAAAHVRIPSALASAFATAAQRHWIAGLPAVIGDVRERWSLIVGEPYEPGGQTSWTAPAIDQDGREVVLKVAWPHYEATHEADGLLAWNGEGAIRLHRVDRGPDYVALLVERCDPGTPLSRRSISTQDVVISSLLRRLWIEPPDSAPFRTLSELCERWADEFESTAVPDLDDGLKRDALTLLRSLPTDATRVALLFTDLHAANVLAATRDGWLAIDPKPFIGDPTFDVIQHLLNSLERVASEPQRVCARLADELDLDAGRVLRWLFARCVQESPHDPVMVDLARTIGRSW